MRIITGKWKGRALSAPTKAETRPTADKAKETLFSLIENYLLKTGKSWKDVVFVDAFAGSGAVGIEALSRGAKQVIFIEENPDAIRTVYKNLPEKDKAIVYRDNLRLLKAKGTVATVIFLDPPYQQGLIPIALKQLNRRGYITEDTLIIAETEDKEEIKLQSDFEIQDSRRSGRARFHFMHKTKTV